MNIAINIDGQFTKMTGIQFYVDSLLQALYATETPHQVTAFMPAVWSPTLWRDAPQGGGFAWLDHPRAHRDTAGSDCYLQSRPAVQRLGERSPARAAARVLDRRLVHPLKTRTQGLAERRAQAAARRYDVLHTPCAARRESLEYRGRRNVVTIHDVTPLTHAETHSADNIATSRLLFDYARRHADRVLANSEFTKSDIVEHLQVPADRVDVTPLAARLGTRRVTDPAELLPALARFDLRDVPFVLYSGTLEARKNLKRLLDAFAQVTAEPGLRHHRLVLAGGSRGDYGQELQTHAQELGLAERVLFTGYVSGDEMNALMSACAVFAYVSEYEGFGMPALEAMTCGAPVVVSGASSLPEVVGNAGLQAPPGDVKAIGAALYTLLTDCDENARQRSLSAARAREFSWERTAQLTLDSYEAAAL